MSDKLSSYEYVGRAGSVSPTASLAGTQVSVDEIRSAAAISHSDPYPPPSLCGPFVTPFQPQAPSQPYGRYTNNHYAFVSYCLFLETCVVI